MNVRCCSYMLFNFELRAEALMALPEAPIFGHQYQWSNNVTLAMVVVQVLKKEFPDINDARQPIAVPGRALVCLTAHLRFHIQLSNQIPLLANGKTPSKSPQAANCHCFLTIVFVHSLYASVQGLSGWIQCYNAGGSQATPEEMSGFSKT